MKNQNRFRDNEHIGILDDFRFRIVLLALLVLSALVLLLLKAYFLQLHDGEQHRIKIEKQSIRRIRIPGWRGEIYSADGIVLAGNRTVYDLVFYPEGMRVGGRLSKMVAAMENAAKTLARAIGRTEYPGKSEIIRHLNNTPGMPLLVFSDLSAIERAKVLLKSTQMSVQEISEELAFGTRNYFTRIFTEIVGYTPVQFREKN